MAYWVITDTHFEHQAVINYCGRPYNFEDLILDRISKSVRENDILIHIGDFAFRNEEHWLEEYMSVAPRYTYLVKGNHDKRSDVFYLSRGFGSVSTQLQIKRHGLNILFSHKPVKDTGNFDVNIFGHFHNNPLKNCEKNLVSRLTNKHILLALENNHYAPWNLEKLVRKGKKGYVQQPGTRNQN